MFAMITRLPQPLKAFYLLFFAAFAAALVTFFLGSEQAISVAYGLLGAVAVLIGLTLVTNLNGAADALAEAAKSYRPMGIDYSRSIMTSPRFTRVFGAAFLAVGVVFVAQAVAQL
jgi:hypothetical protein